MRTLDEIIQPGTPCGCNDYATVAHLHTVTLPGALIAKPEGGTIRGPQRTKNVERCPNDAVRMVLVRVYKNWRNERYIEEGHKIPMCEPCAAYHEQKAGARDATMQPGTRCQSPTHNELLDGAIADYNEITNERLRGGAVTEEQERNAARYVNRLLKAEAVRMVTVVNPHQSASFGRSYHPRKVAMCEPCAAAMNEVEITPSTPDATIARVKQYALPGSNRRAAWRWLYSVTRYDSGETTVIGYSLAEAESWARGRGMKRIERQWEHQR